MVGQRAAGNGNFDIDAIRMAANAMENAPTVTDQPFIDPVAEAIANDLDDMIDQLIANPLSHVGDELTRSMEMILASPLASKLGAGFIAQVQNSLNIQEERIANGSAAFTRGDGVWEEREKREEKERTDKARAASIAEDMNEIAERRQAEIERREAEYANVDVTMGDITMTGRNWRAAAMLMRDENFRREMEAWARARGYTDAEIEEAATVSEEIMLKNARGESLTPEEQRASEENELVRENIRRSAERVQPGVTNSLDAQAVTVSAEVATETATVDARLDVLSGGSAASAMPSPRTSVTAQIEGQTEFTTAPSLRDHHRASLAATTPLDQPAPQQQIANVTPSAHVVTVANSGAGGFDV